MKLIRLNIVIYVYKFVCLKYKMDLKTYIFVSHFLCSAALNFGMVEIPALFSDCWCGNLPVLTLLYRQASCRNGRAGSGKQWSKHKMSGEVYLNYSAQSGTLLRLSICSFSHMAYFLVHSCAN